MTSHNLETNKGWVSVGRVHSAHGLKGDLYIQLFSGEAHWLKELKQALFSLNPKSQSQKNLDLIKSNCGILDIPHKKVFKQGLKIQLENIDSRTKADGFVNLLFSIPEEFLVSKPGEEIYLREVMNYEVFDSDKSIGFVSGFSSNGMQDLLIVTDEKKERSYDIPFIHEFTDQIDHKNNKIIMTLPEGLLDL
ncbi:MAG: 16S rRNA processing protein RimM [Bdellovibrionaceae bacterium]|jgi:16S rRNA processing protein RimM|nr:16S rRNA processing protein RimM [Pseudobdellovibrionaceae bacterium]